MENKKIRINRYLFLNNFCSRREADRWIEDGLVLVNNKKAILGQKIDIQNDKVKILKKAVEIQKNKITILINKPKGYVSHNPQKGEKDILELVPYKQLSPIGRLDKKSYGLMILSDDGRLVNKILNPNFYHEKEYIIKVNKKITSFFLNQMEKGVNIEGYKTKKAKVKKISDRKFNLILTEGKKHQIRRMCQALGYTVVDLQRIRIMNWKIGNLKSGEWKKISKEEIHNFLEDL